MIMVMKSAQSFIGEVSKGNLNQKIKLVKNLLNKNQTSNFSQQLQKESINPLIAATGIRFWIPTVALGLHWSILNLFT